MNNEDMRPRLDAHTSTRYIPCIARPRRSSYTSDPFPEATISSRATCTLNVHKTVAVLQIGRQYRG